MCSGRRRDGYHALESLVAFAGTGDTLTFAPGRTLDLAVEGPMGVQAGPDRGQPHRQGRPRLGRAGRGPALGRVPPHQAPAGSGGRRGRLLGRRGGAASSGAPQRSAARPSRRARRGARHRGGRSRLPRAVRADDGGRGRADRPRAAAARLFGVLVNPGVPVETSVVFKRLGLRPGEFFEGDAHPAIESDLTRRHPAPTPRAGAQRS